MGNLVGILTSEPVFVPTGMIMKVSEITWDGVVEILPERVTNLVLPYNRIHPITINEEWLLKAKFEWSIFHQAIHKEGFPFDLNSLFYGGYSMSTFKKAVVIFGKIEFVHDLQNIYFDLTGTELFETEEQSI
jgi:hypothetical protein